MNYKHAGIAEIETIANHFPDYSLGQIIYAILNRKPEGISVNQWLFTISDEDLYTEIEKTKLIEQE